jgi:DNA mismatch repair protein MutS
MTMIEILSQSQTSFITATHLHELGDIERLKNIKNVCKYHLHVDFDESQHTLIYDRTLREGSGISFYGLQVAKYLMDDKNFINKATEIHKEIGNTMLINDKKSRYNSQIYMTKCQICNKEPKKNEVPLETHHITFQKDCDKNGKLNDKKYIHKNNKSNLVVLCQKCHDKVDNGKLIISGYQETSQNKALVYNFAN